MRKPSSPTVFIVFQFLTEALGIFILVLALSPRDITLKGDILGSSVQFTTGELLPLPSSLLPVYVGAGLSAFFVILFFSVLKYALGLGSPRKR